MDFNSIRNSYEDYSESYSSLIDLLNEILEAGEITNEDKETLDVAYSNYGTDLMNVKRSLETSKDTILEDRINALENNKLDATTESVANILTNNGRNNSVFIDEDGKLFIDGEYIPKLTLVELDVQKLQADYAEITELVAKKATIEDLTATNAKITNLTADVAHINELVAGNITSDNIHSLILTGEKVTVENGFIKNAMIESLAANKINTGELDTNLVRIVSNDGSLTLNGSLQQFRDSNNKVRIQMGKDAEGNFTFALLDAEGTGTIINADGITEKAIGTGLIVNEMINDNANIPGNKLDIDSVFREANENGTETLKTSKIKFDETNQTLDIAFNELKTQADDTKTETSANTTAVKVTQGQISTLISNTTITEDDGTTKTLKDAYNSTVSTVSGMTTTIGEHKTIIDENTGKITTVTADVTQIKVDLTGITTRVSKMESNAENTIAKITQLYYLSTSKTELINGTWVETLPSIEEQKDKFLWIKTVTTYVDSTKPPSETDPICLTGQDGQLYRVEIIPSNGNIFRNGTINTVLTAKVYKNEIEITDTLNASSFKWKKVDKDGALDEVWNSKHFGGTKSVNITSSDVLSKASFYCEIDI